jgi:hypothetical protein
LKYPVNLGRKDRERINALRTEEMKLTSIWYGRMSGETKWVTEGKERNLFSTRFALIADELDVLLDKAGETGHRQPLPLNTAEWFASLPEE